MIKLKTQNATKEEPQLKSRECETDYTPVLDWKRVNRFLSKTQWL